jgi:hypothetical protein
MRDNSACTISDAGLQPPRPVYLLRLQSPCGADARRLRWCLKMMLRRLGLKCISIEIEAPK